MHTIVPKIPPTEADRRHVKQTHLPCNNTRRVFYRRARKKTRVADPKRAEVPQLRPTELVFKLLALSIFSFPFPQLLVLSHRLN